MSKGQAESVFAQRLRQVRQATGLSQKGLGIAAGLDRFVASTRINRYERSVSWPDLSVILKLAEVLSVPAPLLIAEDDKLAELIELFGRASKRKQGEVLKMLRSA